MEPELDSLSLTLPLPYRVAFIIVLGISIQSQSQSEGFLTSVKLSGPGAQIYIIFPYSRLCVLPAATWTTMADTCAGCSSTYTLPLENFSYRSFSSSFYLPPCDTPHDLTICIPIHILGLHASKSRPRNSIRLATNLGPSYYRSNLLHSPTKYLSRR